MIGLLRHAMEGPRRLAKVCRRKVDEQALGRLRVPIGSFEPAPRAIRSESDPL